MKKTLILFLVLLTSSCTILTSYSGAVDPTVLDPVSGLLFERTGDVSYIFFSKEQYVLIENKNHSVNSYYKLLNGEVYRDDVVTYQLDGWGSYDGQYIGLYIETDENHQITEEDPFPETKLGITLQNNRTLAINATKNLGSSSSSRDVTVGKELQSTALYTLKVLSPVVKTSAAGIFKPDENTFLSIKNLTPEHPANHAILVKSEKDKDNGTLTSVEYALTYDPTPNLSDNSAIYHYNTDGKLYLIGVKFDFDFNSDFPRLQIIERETPPDLLGVAIANLELELNNVITWEYGFFSFLRVLDNSLDPFKDILFIQFVPTLKVYNPLVTSRWFINSTEDSIRISTTTNSTYTEEDYLIGPTSIGGVFELIDFRNNDEAQMYSGKFFTITSEGDVTTEGNIVTALIADTMDGFDKAIVTNQLKRINDVTPWPLALQNKTTIENLKLGELSPGIAIPGRSGFQAYVETDTDIIHLVGGYTNSGVFSSGIPRIWETDQTDLQKIYNAVWTITGIGAGDPVSADSGLKLSSDDVFVPFQQMVGAVTKKTPARPYDIFWSYGASTDSIHPSQNKDRFSYNNTTIKNWNTFGLNKDFFRGKHHSAMVAHNNSLYIMGGTCSLDAIKNITVQTTEIPGEFKNDIYITPTINTVSVNTWRSLPTTGTIWSPRVHSRVFSIGKTLVLVGGIDGGSGNTVTPTPVNDVWISENNGTNWTQTRSSTPPTAGGPPKQASIHDGPLIGTVHGGIIYLLDPLTRNVSYSPNKGLDWYKSPLGFELDTPTALYGAQLVAIKDELILIGGQTVVGDIAGKDTTAEGATAMESKIYKSKIDIK